MKDYLQQIRTYIDTAMDKKERILIAIDGSCTAGKTTLANQLAQIYDCNVIHMDDFFLRPEQRTEARYAQPGGNVDYERFREEVLIPLQSGLPFSYHPFDCGSFTLALPVTVTPKKLTIVEGTYSQHPYFENPYDLKFFLTVTPEIQRQRILARLAFLHQRFFEEWIPMEHTYFDTFGIPSHADLVLSTEQ